MVRDNTSDEKPKSKEGIQWESPPPTPHHSPSSSSDKRGSPLTCGPLHMPSLLSSRDSFPPAPPAPLVRTLHPLLWEALPDFP